MTVVLPIIAILSITGEWSQRTGLTTFTLVPHRNRVIAAKAVSSVAVAIASMLFAFVDRSARQPGGNRDHRDRPGVGRVPRRGREHRAGQPALPADRHHAGHADPQLGGGTGGVLRLLAPAAHGLRLLATSQDWFRDLQPWVDLNYAQAALFEGTLTGEQWANVAVTASIWLVLPASSDSGWS